MSASSYEPRMPDAMPVSAETPGRDWIELEGHRRVDEAVSRWLSEPDGSETFRVSGAAGVGKSGWLGRFTAKSRRAGGHSGPRLRWVIARFGPGEPVRAESLVRQWSVPLARHVERPRRYRDGTQARTWLDLAIQAQQAEGFAVVRVVESDRGLLRPGRELEGLTRGVLWLAREPFRGSREGASSIVLPVWSHDELAHVLARKYPAMDWPEEAVSRIWARSRGHARLALKLARALTRASGRAGWSPGPGPKNRFEFPAA